MKRMLYLALLCALLLTACGAPSAPVRLDPPDQSAPPVPTGNGAGSGEALTVEPRAVAYDPDGADWDLLELAPDLNEGEEVSCLTVDSSPQSGRAVLYYGVERAVPGAQRAGESRIVRQDLETGERVVLAEYTGTAAAEVRGMVCAGGQIFWSMQTGAGAAICRYDDQSGQVSTLAEYPGASAPDLGGDDRFLLWYDPAVESRRLLCWDAEEDARFEVTDRPGDNLAFSGLQVGDGLTAWVERLDGEKTLFVYDLERQAYLWQLVVPEELEVARLQVNEDHLIFTDGYGADSALYTLSKDQRVLEQLELSGRTCGIFSCHLYEDEIWINDNQNGQVIVIQLDSGSYAGWETDYDLVQAGLSPRGEFYANDPESGQIVVMDKSGPGPDQIQGGVDPRYDDMSNSEIFQEALADPDLTEEQRENRLWKWEELNRQREEDSSVYQNAVYGYSLTIPQGWEESVDIREEENGTWFYMKDAGDFEGAGWLVCILQTDRESWQEIADAQCPHGERYLMETDQGVLFAARPTDLPVDESLPGAVDRYGALMEQVDSMLDSVQLDDISSASSNQSAGH